MISLITAKRGVKRHYDGTPVTPKRTRVPLPTELLARIISFSEDRDLMQWRAVSRDMKQVVEDAHVWFERAAARGWLMPPKASGWVEADMLAHYRATAELTEDSLYNSQRLHMHVDDANAVRAAAGRFPATLTLLRLSSGPNAEVVEALGEQYSLLRHLFVRFYQPVFAGAAIRNLGSFSHLRAIDIGTCGAVFTTDTLAELVESVALLQSLSLRGSTTLTGPDLLPLAGAENLECLCLEDCAGIESLPSELARLERLRSLELSVWSVRPHLKQRLIGQVVSNFPNLEHLDLWGRRVSSRNHNLLIPLGTLPLKTLNVGHTRIQTLPPELCLSTLEDLNVSRNTRFRFPDETQKMQNLRTLDFSSTDQTCFPRILLSLTSLTSVDASWNLQLAFPHPLEPLVNLRELQLQSCDLTRFPEAVLTAPNLEKLRLEGSDLRRLPLSLARLTKLTHLDLGSNAVWDVMPRVITKMDHLTWLSLPRLAKTVQPRFAQMFPKLRYLRMNSINTSGGSRRRDKRRGIDDDDFVRSVQGCDELRAVAFDAAWWFADGYGPAGVRARAIRGVNFDHTYDR